jgi:diguanylate cyclase (GGDEF)-like protein
MFLYYHHIVPKLLQEAQEKKGDDLKFLTKKMEIEAETIQLRKSIADTIEGFKPPEVYSVDVKHGNSRRFLGRYMLHAGKIHHLEDHHGVLNQVLPEGDMDLEAISKLHGLQWSPSFHVEPHHHTPEATEPAEPVEVVKDAPPRPPGVFSYHRVGMPPAVVEFGPHGAAINGSMLGQHEQARILENVKSGLAVLRYHTPESDALRKDEPEMEPDEALNHIRAGVKAGHIPPEVERALTRHIYEDKMTPGIGNKYAYTQFRSQNKPGVYISADANDFKSINDTYGHDAGDEAIKSIGHAIRTAANKVGNIKTFRPGGDEFVFHAPTHEHAMQLISHIKNHLDAVPPVGGTHSLSVSFGTGADFKEADQNLYNAKARKTDPVTKQRAFPVGKVPHQVHTPADNEPKPTI